ERATAERDHHRHHRPVRSIGGRYARPGTGRGRRNLRPPPSGPRGPGHGLARRAGRDLRRPGHRWRRAPQRCRNLRTLRRPGARRGRRRRLARGDAGRGASRVSQPAIELREVSRRYPGSPPVDSLRGVSLRVERGELLAVMGPSGSGKSTLLHVIGTLDRPTEGTVCIDGVDTGRMSDRTLSGLRAERLGFVFQQFYLLDGLRVLDNVAAGLIYRGVDAHTRQRFALDALERV